jgi:hypothetical protein
MSPGRPKFQVRPLYVRERWSESLSLSRLSAKRHALMLLAAIDVKKFGTKPAARTLHPPGATRTEVNAMISRIVTVAALAAGTLLCVAAQAQTGTYGQTPVTPGVSAQTGTTGSVGTSTMPRGSSTSTTTGVSGGASTNNMGAGAQGNMNTNVNTQGNVKAQGNMNAQTGAQGSMQGGSMQGNAQAGGRYQAQARGTRMTDAAERQITECLNGAAAQQKPFDSCRR